MDFCTQLSLNLLTDALKNDNSNTNLVFSPMSYNVTLNMIAGAASGSTLKEMLMFLRCVDIRDVNSNSLEMMRLSSDGGDENRGGRGSGPVIHCLNGIWLDQSCGLKASYGELAWKIYKALVKRVDFVNKADEVVKDANAWAKASTEGLITDVLSEGELNGSTFVLGNALYFKGIWEEGFDPKWTLPMLFYLMDGGTNYVPFMTGCKNYSQGSFHDFEVIRIPYQRGQNGNMFSMYFFLPRDTIGLEGFLRKVAADRGFLQRDFNLWDSYDGSFWIPKFKFSCSTSKGAECMWNMGLTSPFDLNGSGLTEMVNNGSKTVSKIVQKSFIEVDEKGTKAAAVTIAYGSYEAGSRMSKPPFIADHPFMFMIREDISKFILFTGVVLDPTMV